MEKSQIQNLLSKAIYDIFNLPEFKDVVNRAAVNFTLYNKTKLTKTDAKNIAAKLIESYEVKNAKPT